MEVFKVVLRDFKHHAAAIAYNTQVTESLRREERVHSLLLPSNTRTRMPLLLQTVKRERSLPIDAAQKSILTPSSGLLIDAGVMNVRKSGNALIPTSKLKMNFVPSLH